MSNTRKPLAKTVKDTIDFVFEILTSNPGGYEMSAKELGQTGRKVVAILVERGILERNHACNGKKSRYQWVAAMAPTKVLYGSVTQELADRNREEKKKYYEKHKARTSVSRADNVVEEEPVPAPAVETFHDGPVQVAPSLDPFSAQELWDELKRRGYSADENGLFIVKKTYLD